MARKREQPLESAIAFKPRGARQAQAIDTFINNDIVFLTGPAGTGKTHLAIYMALMDMPQFNQDPSRKVEKIVITRPVVEAGENLGALPGEVEEKVHPYMLPLYDCASKIIHNGTKFIDEHFEIAPLAYMRGRTFENCTAILDEAQNCTVAQLLLFLTRLGEGGKMIISGDTDQSDIRGSGLRKWVDSLQGVGGIGFVEFTEADIVRHKLVREIIARKPK